VQPCLDGSGQQLAHSLQSSRVAEEKDDYKYSISHLAGKLLIGYFAGGCQLQADG